MMGVYLVLGVLFASLVHAFQINSDQFNGVYCVPMSMTGGSFRPSINLELAPMDESFQLAVLVVRNLDLLDVDFPLASEYSDKYPFATAPFVCDDESKCTVGKFKVENLSSNSYNDIISKDAPKREYPIAENGAQCIYIQPNDPSTPFVLKIDITESYGYIDPINHRVLRIYPLVNLIGFVILGFFLYYLLLWRKDFKRLSIISHASLFWILLPYVIINVANHINMHIINHYDNSMTKLFDVFLKFDSIAFKYYMNWAFLIFNNGYGVIFQSLHDIESTNLKKSYFLLFGAIIVVSLSSIFFSPGGAAMISGLCDLAFFVVNIMAYKITKKVLTELPKSDSFKLFRKSFIVVVLFPIFIVVLMIIIFGLATRSSLSLGAANQSDRAREIIFLEKLEDNNLYYLLVFMPFFQFYFTIVLIFFIWVKDNNGLVEDQLEGIYHDEEEVI